MKGKSIHETRNEAKKNVRYMEYRISEITMMLKNNFKKYEEDKK